MRSLLTFCSCQAGSRGGSLSKTSLTAGGLDRKKCCERRTSETSACMWTRPTAPHNEGTLFNQQPCLQSMSSQMSVFLIWSLAHACLAALTAPLRQAWAVALAAMPCLSLSFCAAVVHAVFHHQAAFGWKGLHLWRTNSLVSWMSLARLVAACSSSSLVGAGGKAARGGQLQKEWIHASFLVWSVMKPVSISSLGNDVGVSRCPKTLIIVWSDLRLPSQSTLRFENVVDWIAAALYQTRLIVESRSCSVPLHVISPGLFARVSRLVAAHSSMQPAQ